MASISVDVDVDIDDFDDLDILRAAARIVKGELRGGRDPARYLAEPIEQLKMALLPDHEPTEPLSTAARMTSYNEVRKLIESSPTLYRFAGQA